MRQEEGNTPAAFRVPCARFPVVDDTATQMVSESSQMRSVIEQVRRIAPTSATVLIEGECGTGKELVARLLHDASARAAAPFIRINCAAFSEGLVESELFGHVKGAFTGADQEHIGRFERASGGTLLLDEVGEMPLRQQAKLLRVLEQQEFERVGGDQTLRVDVRVIATTNRVLQSETVQGGFRPDLYYRLSGVEIYLPPLRSRLEDVPPLVRHFIRMYGHEGLVRVRDISAGALSALETYSWPGNIRQLRNVIHRACILAGDEVLRVADLPPLREPMANVANASAAQTLAEIERGVILQTLREVGGNKTAAAQRLGVTSRTLLNKLKRYRDDEAA